MCQAAPVPAPTQSAAATKPTVEVNDEKPTPMEVDEAPVTAAVAVEKVEVKPVQSSPKKKKKASYKNMMQGMMNKDSSPDKLQKEKESLRNGLGGGAFSKIDKI